MACVPGADSTFSALSSLRAWLQHLRELVALLRLLARADTPVCGSQVQVIPWVLADSNFVRSPSQRLDPSRTVFVGALHGMLNAEALAAILNDLFGGVVYAGIDTDKHKYPIGECPTCRVGKLGGPWDADQDRDSSPWEWEGLTQVCRSEPAGSTAPFSTHRSPTSREGRHAVIGDHQR